MFLSGRGGMISSGESKRSRILDQILWELGSGRRGHCRRGAGCTLLSRLGLAATTSGSCGEPRPATSSISTVRFAGRGSRLTSDMIWSHQICFGYTSYMLLAYADSPESDNSRLAAPGLTLRAGQRGFSGRFAQVTLLVKFSCQVRPGA